MKYICICGYCPEELRQHGVEANLILLVLWLCGVFGGFGLSGDCSEH